MSSVFMNQMQDDLAEDAALTEQRPRQSFAEDRTPDEAMDSQTESGQDTDFIFDGLLEAIKRRRLT